LKGVSDSFFNVAFASYNRFAKTN